MSNIMKKKEEIVSKILLYEKEYLMKKNISDPDVETIVMMRRAVSLRLKKEIKELLTEHQEITNQINKKIVANSWLTY